MKKILALSCTAILILGLVACSSKEPEQLVVPLPGQIEMAPTPPTEPAPSIKEEEEAPTTPPVADDAQWEEVITNHKYSMNWESARIKVGDILYIEQKTNEDGSRWEIAQPIDESRGELSVVYRTSDSLYYTDKTADSDFNWRKLDTSGIEDIANTSTYNTFGYLATKLFVEQSFALKQEVLYNGQENGLDVIQINCEAGVSMTLYMTPETHEVHHMFLDTSDMCYTIEFTKHTNRTIDIPIPENVTDMIAPIDVLQQQVAFQEKLFTEKGLNFNAPTFS